MTKPEEIKDLVTLLKAAGDPLRLEILSILKNSSFGVQELASLFEMPQPGISHHLKVLSKAELITSRREGTGIFYRRQASFQNSPWSQLKRSLFSAADDLPQRNGITSKLDDIHALRSAQSLSFFDKHADEFKHAQGKIVSYPQYSSNLEELIEGTLPSNAEQALEVGPGNGELLTYLNKRVPYVVGIDNSDSMLNNAKLSFADDKAKKPEFIHGDIESLTHRFEGEFDLIVLNMVLHHIPDPAEKMILLSKLLKDNGILLIADLCEHEQEWVKDSCGDIWLGFQTEELDTWGQDAGLSPEQSVFLGLKNGFQIQIKVFRFHA
ncbi:MAG: metalloregulator ArsR/SmtB family transcription factor [Pseudobacteriovorax sp.]|nr:metalloregulator ArsR/SmtB family transcription factor [Pseudobacteriovorax sp.]